MPLIYYHYYYIYLFLYLLLVFFIEKLHLKKDKIKTELKKGIATKYADLRVREVSLYDRHIAIVQITMRFVGMFAIGLRSVIRCTAME